MVQETSKRTSKVKGFQEIEIKSFLGHNVIMGL
jgi:hypothetical protein